MKATPDLSNPVIQEYNSKIVEKTRKKQDKTISILEKIAIGVVTAATIAALVYAAKVTDPILDYVKKGKLQLVNPADSYGEVYKE